MTLFELVKQNICVPDAAKHYGLQVNRNGMCSCPFHEDQHPSMKLNERYFYCFGCGATGDVIDLVARLFGLNSYEAAQKLAQDFGIDPDKPPAAIALTSTPLRVRTSWRPSAICSMSGTPVTSARSAGSAIRSRAMRASRWGNLPTAISRTLTIPNGGSWMRRPPRWFVGFIV